MNENQIDFEHLLKNTVCVTFCFSFSLSLSSTCACFSFSLLLLSILRASSYLFHGFFFPLFTLLYVVNIRTRIAYIHQTKRKKKENTTDYNMKKNKEQSSEIFRSNTEESMVFN